MLVVTFLVRGLLPFKVSDKLVIELEIIDWTLAAGVILLYILSLNWILVFH